MADLGSQEALLADVDAKVNTNGANENTGARVNANLRNIVDTLWNHAGIVDVGTCLFVNADTGDDVTGVRGRMDLQFATIDGALAASGLTAGDTIIGFDSGIHSITSLITLNINFYFPNGTISGNITPGVDGITMTIQCKLHDGIIDAIGAVTSGHTITIRDTEGVYEYYPGDDSTTNIIRSNVFRDDSSIGSGSVVNIENSRVKIFNGASATGTSVYLKNSYVESFGVACTLYANGSVFGLPITSITTLDPSSTSNVGLSPLLTASFSYFGPTGDPGTARWGVDDGTFADITKVRLSTTDYNGNDISTYLDAQTSGQLELRTLDYSKRILFTVTGVSGTGTYRTFDVTPVLGSFPINDEFYTFDFREAGSASTPQTLADTLIEGQTTSGRSIIISEFDGINFEQGVNQVRLKAPATATDARTQTLQDADGVIALVSDIPLTDSIGGLIEVAADTTYRLGGPSAFAYTIESLDVETDSGTITVAVKINGTPVTGLSAVSASSTPASATATAANTVAVGDYLTFEGSSNSAATGLLFGITITRTP